MIRVRAVIQVILNALELYQYSRVHTKVTMSLEAEVTLYNIFQ